MEVLTIDFQAGDAKQKFARSLHETGFAVLKNHPLNWGDIETAYREWEGFFTSDVRHQYPFKKDTQDGYVSPALSETAKGNTLKDLKSFYHLYFPQGRYPHTLSDATRRNFDRTFALGATLLSWIEHELPSEIRSKLSCPLRDMISLDRSLYRILYYPPLSGGEEPGAIRAAAHEDINLITILPAATDSGLQVKDKKGNWHDVQVDPHTIVVNIGDMLQEATEYYYISTTHRVINPSGEQAKRARLSMPTFVHAKADVRISERYPTAAMYLDERLQELGLL